MYDYQKIRGDLEVAHEIGLFEAHEAKIAEPKPTKDHRIIFTLENAWSRKVMSELSDGPFLLGLNFGRGRYMLRSRKPLKGGKAAAYAKAAAALLESRGYGASHIFTYEEEEARHEETRTRKADPEPKQSGRSQPEA